MNGHWIQKPQQNAIVIFVHGILSSAENCWKSDNGAYWLDLLSKEKEFAKLGIYAFSYNTGIFSGSYSLDDVVDALKEHLKLDGILAQDKQLIFVCHSMGGIVVRKFLVERQTYLINLDIQIGLFLVASPSLGSDYANLITGFAKILNIRNIQAETLRFSQNNTWLNGLDKEFINTKESGHLTIIGKELIEDKPIILKSWFKKQVVEPFSGARYFGEHIKIPNSDHSTIAKPENKDAFQHRLLCQFINDFFDEFKKKSTHKFIEKTETSLHIDTNHLPKPTTKLIGRKTELIQLHDSIRDKRIHLAIIVAAGGIGKSAL